MKFFKSLFKNSDQNNLKRNPNISGCIKCYNTQFKYDHYQSEYICEKCGWTVTQKPLGEITVKGKQIKKKKSVEKNIIKNIDLTDNGPDKSNRKAVTFGSNWYLSEDNGKHLRQVVIEVPPTLDSENTKSQFGILMLAAKYQSLITGTWTTGLFRLDTNSGPYLMIRTDGLVEVTKNAPKKIGFSFFRMNSSGIIGIYVYIDSDHLREKGSIKHPYIEIGCGLDEQDGVQRFRDAFKNETLTLVLAGESNSTHSSYNESTGKLENYVTPQCEHDIQLILDVNCRKTLSKELEDLCKYHRSIPSGRRDFNTGLNEMWAVMPEQDNPILQRPS